MAATNSQLSLAQKLEASQNVLLGYMDALQSPSTNVSVLKLQLINFTESLVGHLQMQNEEFFRILEKNYLQLKRDSQMSFFFQAQLKQLKVELYTFMENYLESQWTVKKRNFNQDLRNLIDAVRGQIEVERAYMIPYCN